jgi:hypothetical protein
MSFGTPQRVQALRKEYEKSLRTLSSGSTEKNLSFYEDSLDGDDDVLRAFNSGKSSSPSSRSRNVHNSDSTHRGGFKSGSSAFVRREYASIDDKDRLIVELQDEVARLRGKINAVVESAEGSLQEAIEAQETLREDYTKRIGQKDQDVEHVRDENVVLKDMINKLQLELAYEREQVNKGLRFMDRVKSAGNQRFNSLLDKSIFKSNVHRY